MLIGPEGDFSPHELNRCLTLGFQPVTLGNNRLRTETAALYALTALNFMNGWRGQITQAIKQSDNHAILDCVSS